MGSPICWQVYEPATCKRQQYGMLLAQTHCLGCRRTSQDVGNILGALYLAMLFLGIINSRTVQPPTSYERSVGALPRLSLVS